MTEAESPAFRAWFDEQDAVLVSRLGVLEMERVLLRAGAPRSALDPLVERVDVIALDEAVLHRAGSAGPAVLRTLDAIHLAAAIAVLPLTGTFATYDHRLADAAAGHGFAVVAPL